MSLGIDNRLHEILRVLDSIKQSLLQKISLSTQNPKEANKTVLLSFTTLSHKLQDYVRRRNMASVQNIGDELLPQLDQLNSLLKPYDAELNTMTLYWIRKLFEEHPFTPSHEHIKTVETVEKLIPQ